MTLNRPTNGDLLVISCDILGGPSKIVLRCVRLFRSKLFALRRPGVLGLGLQRLGVQMCVHIFFVTMITPAPHTLSTSEHCANSTNFGSFNFLNIYKMLVFFTFSSWTFSA